MTTLNGNFLGTDQGPAASDPITISEANPDNSSGLQNGKTKPMAEVSNHVASKDRTSSSSKSSSKEHHHGHPKENSAHKSSSEKHSSSKHHHHSSSHSSDKEKSPTKEHKHHSSSKSSKDGKSSEKSSSKSNSSSAGGGSSSKGDAVKTKEGEDVTNNKHREKSSKHESSSKKHKDGSSSSKHKSSHHNSSSSSSKHDKDKHHKSRSEKHSSGDKHSEKRDKEKSSSVSPSKEHHHSSSDKNNVSAKKPSAVIEPPPAVAMGGSPPSSVGTASPIKIKGEPTDSSSPASSPNKIKMESPSSPLKNHHTKEFSSPIKTKLENLSEDDVPLSSRNPIKKETKIKIKRDLDESDDEPLSSRAEKKLKSKSSQKRKVEDDDFQPQQANKKVKKELENKMRQTNTSAKKKTPTRPGAGAATTPTKKKKLKEEEEEVWKWWEEEKKVDGTKWKTLSHRGPVFAPDYEPLPKTVKFFYDGKVMGLSPEAEEVGGFYARMLEHDYVTKESFNKNFFKDWKKCMTNEERTIITDLRKCNFKQYAEYFKMKTEERKAMTKEQKNEIKKKNEEMTAEYGFCVIDGHKQKIGNFKIEPPGLFRGRGEHPKMGMLKRRIMPENVIINIGKEAPKVEPPPGRKWKEVRSDNSVTWLACWTENILNQNKYIMLNPSSKLKGEKDFNKYEMARQLKTKAPRIRSDYEQDWKNKEMKIRQRAVALYFIDKLALRAGNEKEEGETADTVGCCSLRVEHITLDERKDGKENVVTFDFLGKDSIRYINSVSVEKRVFKNVKIFMENKQPGDDLFDRLNTTILNKYLNDLMEGLTAKVFRTYNASKTLQEQLDELTKEDMSMPEKLLAYNRANRAVAILCNHQRSTPKTFDKQMENMGKKIEEKENQIVETKQELKNLKNSNSGKMLIDKKKKRLAMLEEQLKRLEVQQTDKEENKQIALGTSKLNYLDPRISVAWCKKWEVPIEKIYNRTQRDKFRWAIEMATPDYKF